MLVQLNFVTLLPLFVWLAGESSARHFHGIKKYYAKYPQSPPAQEAARFKQSRLCAATNDGGPPYRYYKPTRQCYMIGERGPCGEMMEFTLIDRDYGTCDCSQKERCGRPLIYWPQQKRCYRVNEQGPCILGKWLTFGMYQTPVCRRNPCESQMRRDPSRGSQFWFEQGGQCFKTGTQGSCTANETLLNQWEDYKPKCYDSETQLKCLRSPVHAVSCLPGMRHNHAEECLRNRQDGIKPEERAPLPNIYHLHLE